MFLNDSRKEYAQYQLDDSAIEPDPYHQFKKWYQVAELNNHYEANAMHVATVNSRGFPSSRVVLLKFFNREGYGFFTNYQSQKAADISNNPHVALTFYWPSLEQQVRIEGVANKVSRDLSVQYFQTRPRDSQLAAWASDQSKAVANRQVLEASMDDCKKKYKGDVPCPDHWGGYIVLPTRYEFWQGRKNRCHDRIAYTKNQSNWLNQRLSP